jgi:hypothetical protein
MIDNLRTALDKLTDAGLLQESQNGMFSLAANDLRLTGPALKRLTAKYGSLVGFEAEVLGRVPVLLYANGPMTLQEISQGLAWQSAALRFKADL